jgi:hypothetical protein
MGLKGINYQPHSEIIQFSKTEFYTFWYTDLEM